jgi:hypothetical protein
MGSIGRYIFRTTFGAFLLVLVSITGLMWITQALHDVDLVTSQGQSVLTFIGVTGLFILAYELHKLSADSELIVMNAAGRYRQLPLMNAAPAVLNYQTRTVIIVIAISLVVRAVLAPANGLQLTMSSWRASSPSPTTTKMEGISGRFISAPWDSWPSSAAVARKLAELGIYILRRIVPKDRGNSWPGSLSSLKPRSVVVNIEFGNRFHGRTVYFWRNLRIP